MRVADQFYVVAGRKPGGADDVDRALGAGTLRPASPEDITVEMVKRARQARTDAAMRLALEEILTSPEGRIHTSEEA